jgi:hypothetical protein
MTQGYERFKASTIPTAYPQQPYLRMKAFMRYASAKGPKMSRIATAEASEGIRYIGKRGPSQPQKTGTNRLVGGTNRIFLVCSKTGADRYMG